MAVKIRLKRLGRRKRPFYRVVVMDSRSRRDGAEIERLGWFDPLATNGEQVKLNHDRIYHWLGEGAIPSNTVQNLLSKEGIALRWHLMKQGKSEAEVDAALQVWEAKQEDLRKRHEALAAQDARTKKAKTKKGDGQTSPDPTEEPSEAMLEAADGEPVDADTAAETVEAPAADAAPAAIEDEPADAAKADAATEAPAEDTAPEADAAPAQDSAAETAAKPAAAEAEPEAVAEESAATDEAPAAEESEEAAPAGDQKKEGDS